MAHSHGHGHGHGHSDLKGRNLLIATVLNFTITAVQIVGGLLSNSLALLSDAIHNLGDAVAVLLAYIANKIGQRSATERHTFGYKRIEILAALLNAVVIIVITFYLFREAWHRFHNPEPIKGAIMFVVAVVGLLANLYAVVLLKKDSKKNLNVKAAYLHLLGDTVSSVAVIIGSILIYFYEIYWIDPILTVLIGAYILKEGYSILRESVDILMQVVPRSIELGDIKKSIEALPEIDNIHHVHAWNLTDRKIHFECHVDLKSDMNISSTQTVLEEIKEILAHSYEISHVTIQFEHNCCHDKEMIHKDK